MAEGGKIVAVYDRTDADEPALARLHQLDEHGHVSEGPRERFAIFLVEWLGGPTVYSPVHGHPRLRMRHGRVPVDVVMRDAWLRGMARAMDDLAIEGDVRRFLASSLPRFLASSPPRFLDARFAEVADFLRNVPQEG